MKTRHSFCVLAIVAALLTATPSLHAQSPVGTAFTYQGQLKQVGVPVDAAADFQFSLWDDPNTGGPVGPTLTVTNVNVVEGLFTVALDFGSVFTGDAHWLEIAVRCPAGGGTYTTLSPRQELTPTPYALGGPFWNLLGNAGTTAGTHFVGTTDDQALELKVNAGRALRIEPTPPVEGFGFSPNLIGGYEANEVRPGVVGATIDGGGLPHDPPMLNLVTDDFGTVGGGYGNQAGDDAGTPQDVYCATVGGGRMNTATGRCSTVGGGDGNDAEGIAATVAGGSDNTASANGATVGGGMINSASGGWSVVAGGYQNEAFSWSAVGGGDNNVASGLYSVVPGGQDNAASADYSFAAGHRAKIGPDHIGTFVWADCVDFDFSSTGPNQFLIRASGGVGIGTTDPGAKLHVGGVPNVDGIMFPDGTLQTTAAGTGFWADSGSDIYNTNTGNVGIGTLDPATRLHMDGQSLWLTGGNGAGLAANAGAGMRVYYCDAHETGMIWAYDYGEGQRRDIAFQPSGGNVGIGQPSPTYKLHVEVNSSGTAIYAKAKGSGSKTGVCGYAHSTADNPNGASFGVEGYACDFLGTSYGIYGQATGTGTNIGVYGSASGGSTNYGGWFNGNVHVNGTINKSACQFKIDHPLDPADKYLLHACIESPEMKNLYDGVVTLDANGAAWIELPDWFETLNRDFCYQLTAIGAPGPNLYVAQEISDNRFQIGGGKPGMKVSWQVTGIRQDAYAEANPMVVEVDKPAEERGLYLHPEAFGLPEEMGLHYEMRAAAEEASDLNEAEEWEQ